MSEIAQSELARKLFDEKFDATAYYGYYSKVLDFEEFFLNALHQAFKSGKVHGDRILDFSCGPLVHRLGLASRYCKELTFSDFSSQNVAFVQQWLKSETSPSFMKAVFQHVASLEGFENLEEGAKEIEERIKSRTTGVIKCDLHNVNSSPTLTPTQLPFDVVYSGGVLETACMTYESFVPGVKNIANLLKPGGFFICSGFFGMCFYHVGEIKYPSLPTTSEFMENVFRKAGLIILDFQTTVKDPVEGSDYNGYFIAVTQRPENKN